MKTVAQQFIELLHAEEQCPRLTVDATHRGVIVPPFVKAEWKESLPINLDSTYPLELIMDQTGLRCRLSFGSLHDCFFPWDSIYAVQERDSGLGIVIDSNLPKGKTPTTKRESPPSVAAVTENLAQPVALEVAETSSAEDRRAGFQVIDGGKE